MVDIDPRLTRYAGLTHAQRVETLHELCRVRARLDADQALLIHTMAVVPASDLVTDLDKQWVREDIACALQIAPDSARGVMHEAEQLITRLPETHALLAAGRITMRHAAPLVEAGSGLPDDTVTALEARVLPRAPEQSPAQFAQSVRRAVLRLDPRTQADRREEAVAGRRVCFTPQGDGTTALWALLPAETAAALHGAIDTRADALKAADDGRTADQRRADALAELVFGATSVHARVNVTVSLATLLALADEPAELERYGAIPAELARALAFDVTGTWRRLLLDQADQVVDVGRSAYRPPTRLARMVVARQTTCVFPRCRHIAARCELDHIQSWAAGGHTSAANLQPLCPRHHHLRHEAGWEVWRLPDGTTRWRSPAGRTYDRPPDEIPRDSTTDPPGQHAA